MKKYIKSFFLLLFNVAFLIIIFYMIEDYMHWGLSLILIIGFLWYITMSMLVDEIANLYELYKIKKKDNQVTGGDLLSALHIKELYIGWDSYFTTEEILEALERAYLCLERCSFSVGSRCKNEASISPRQRDCVKSTLHYMEIEKYNIALHEFYDCIDDYGKGRNRPVTMNEYVLYNCILTCFLAKLKKKESIAENVELYV